MVLLLRFYSVDREKSKSFYYLLETYTVACHDSRRDRVFVRSKKYTGNSGYSSGSIEITRVSLPTRYPGLRPRLA